MSEYYSHVTRYFDAVFPLCEGQAMKSIVSFISIKLDLDPVDVMDDLLIYRRTLQDHLDVLSNKKHKRLYTVTSIDLLLPNNPYNLYIDN